MEKSNLLEQKQVNNQKKELSQQHLDTSNQQLLEQLDDHERMQNHYRPFHNSIREREALRSKLAQDSDDFEVKREIMLGDVTSPTVEARNVTLENRVITNKLTHVREVDELIRQEFGLTPQLEASANRRENLARGNQSLTQNHLNDIFESIELDRLIKQDQQDNNSGSQGANDQGATVSDQASGSGTAHNQGSGSLVEDFADPNLEQPSYTDPED